MSFINKERACGMKTDAPYNSHHKKKTPKQTPSSRNTQNLTLDFGGQVQRRSHTYSLPGAQTRTIENAFTVRGHMKQGHEYSLTIEACHKKDPSPRFFSVRQQFFSAP